MSDACGGRLSHEKGGERGGRMCQDQSIVHAGLLLLFPASSPRSSLFFFLSAFTFAILALHRCRCFPAGRFSAIDRPIRTPTLCPNRVFPRVTITPRDYFTLLMCIDLYFTLLMHIYLLLLLRSTAAILYHLTDVLS